ncbi:MAG: hypothetical protein ACI4HQ_11560 [Acetatifactor sp.]
MEMTVKGRSYVTARGWEDLSEILYLYEEEQLTVDETLVGQYLRNEKVVKEFTAYYDLYQKYKKDYHIADILGGRASVQAIARAKEAAFDERLSLLGMLLDKVQADMKEVMERGAYLSDLKNALKAVGAVCGKESFVEHALTGLENQAEGRRKLLEKMRSANSLSDAELKRYRSVIQFLEENRKALYVSGLATGEAAYGFLKEKYGALVNRMKQRTGEVQEELHALFVFAEEAFVREDKAGNNELLILMTELTVNDASARFIAAFGSEDYGRHKEEMMLSERSRDISSQIAELKLE